MGKPKSGLQQDDLSPSSLPADHTIVRLGAAQGSGNYQSTDAEGIERLVELSGRVKRSKVIVTRGKGSAEADKGSGDYAFIRTFPDGEGGSRVMGEVVGMISGRDIKTWRKGGEWPSGFDKPVAPAAVSEQSMPIDANDEDEDQRVETASDEGPAIIADPKANEP